MFYHGLIEELPVAPTLAHLTAQSLGASLNTANFGPLFKTSTTGRATSSGAAGASNKNFMIAMAQAKSFGAAGVINKVVLYTATLGQGVGKMAFTSLPLAAKASGFTKSFGASALAGKEFLFAASRATGIGKGGSSTKNFILALGAARSFGKATTPIMALLMPGARSMGAGMHNFVDRFIDDLGIITSAWIDDVGEQGFWDDDDYTTLQPTFILNPNAGIAALGMAMSFGGLRTFTSFFHIAARSSAAAFGQSGSKILQTIGAKSLGAGKSLSSSTRAAHMAASSSSAAEGIFSGKMTASVLARSSGAGEGKAGSNATTALGARSTSMGLDRASLASLVSFATARTIAMGFGRAGASPSASLSGLTRTMAMGRAAPVGNVTISAKTLAASFGRMIPPGVLKLFANTLGATTGRFGPFIGSTSISARSQAAATAKAGANYTAFVGAKSPAMGRSVAGSSFAVFFSTRTLGMSRGTAVSITKLALSAAALATAVGRAATSGRIALGVRGQATARGVLGQNVQMAARSLAAAFGRLFIFRPSGRRVKAPPSVDRAQASRGQ